MSIQHQILHRYNGTVLYECDIPEGLDSVLRTRHALEQAMCSCADLRGADLRGANQEVT